MTISENKVDNKVVLSIEGRVDTTTAPQLQNAILQAYQGAADLELDMTNMEYISSAGLRALLIGQKTASSKGGTMVLTHVNESVNMVFEMSGFASILTIQ